MQDSPSSRGFTLVELAIVILIAGLVTAAMAAIALPILREAQVIGTEGKMQKVAKAIDFYATQNNRVPCPAAPLTTTTNPPFGYERGSGPTGSAVPSPNCGNAGTNRFGIVPYKTLGIPVDWVRDAWGNYLTYAISPAFSQDTAVDFPVDARCRTADWYDAPIIYDQDINGTTIAAPVYTAHNSRKARFCCAYPPAPYDPTSDLIILDAANSSQLVSTRATVALNAGTTAIPYNLDAAPPAGTGQIKPNTFVADTDRPQAPVYILVSHGRNGYNAYNVAAGARPAPLGTKDEKFNGSDTGTFYELDKIDQTGGERDYDDLVVWRTQDLIFADQGQSCATP